MKRILFVLILTPWLCSCGLARSGSSEAIAGFQKLQSLEGAWDGTDDQGNQVKTTFKLIASKTAVMETLSMPGMEEMVTLYSIDGDSIALLHYCPTNNQPRMRATPATGNVKELIFTFEGAGNLPDLAQGHEHKLVLEFQRNNEITEHWTWRKNGRDTEMAFHFARKNPS